MSVDTYKKNERQGFSKRLGHRLQHKAMPVSATALAREFNLRWRGANITVNAVRRWLMGESIPAKDKLGVLADLLDVSEDWLRWGAADIDTAADGATVHWVESAAATYTRSQEVKSLTQDIMLLSPKDREYLRAILNVMLRHSREGK
jgi:transcriptional regulator with XRE-family HTH domain